MPIIIQNGKRVVIPSKNDLYNKEILQDILDVLSADGAEQATTAKQQEIITAINGISGVSTYNFVQKAETSTYVFFGYTNDSGWQIKRKTISSGVWEIAKGLYSGTYADYDTAWADRAIILYGYV